jgi:FixJ family two-component response regulator
MNAMIVDDDAFVRQKLSSYMYEVGVASVCYADPSDALDDFRSRPSCYGLILMDFRFPQGDVGRYFASEMAQVDTAGNAKIVGVTGYSELYNFETRTSWGMSDVLYKPLLKWLVVNLVQETCISM